MVVPVYNVEPYLRRCIDSILNQTLADFRLILVDDGSPDNCGAICDEYAGKDSRIHVIHQKNAGLSAARNTGIDYAIKNGNPEKDWISFIDSDDFIHPMYLEYLYQAAKEANVSVSCCAYVRTQESIISEKQLSFEYSITTPEQFWIQNRTNASISPTKLIRLSCFTDIRFPLNKLHEDEFTTYKVLFPNKQIAVMPVRMYYYYFNPNSITQQWNPRRLDALDALDEQIAFFTDRGFADARRHSTQHLLQHCIKHVMFMNNLSPEYDSMIPAVRERRHRAFRLYAKEVGWKKAFDYWYYIRIEKPTKRVLDKESAFSFLIRRIKKKFAAPKSKK